MNGGRFDFDDGGTYCGGWEDGKAHGHGVCTGPKGQGEYSGAWHYGFEVSGVYTWPSGNCYEGQWQNGKRHGLGDERRGRWVYKGEWNQGYKGRYGVRQSSNSHAKYEGTWANGLQDGYGTETYADGGTYRGQWLRGMRHGYGTRHSAQYGSAARYRSRSQAHDSLNSLRSDQGTDENAAENGNEKDDSRGGFVLRARSEPPSRRRSLSSRSVAVKRTILQGLRIKKQRSTGDIDQRVGGGSGETPRSIRSSGSTMSCASDESAVPGYTGRDHGPTISPEELVDSNVTEAYMGEWKNDKRSGFGVSERSDGLKYEGEWFNNKKYGYGVTTLKDRTREEGKYKNNVIVTSQRKRNLVFVRSSKLRERIEAAVTAAARAAQIAIQKTDIATTRSAAARERADQADSAALQAREDSEIARLCGKQFAPDFLQPGAELVRKRHHEQLINHRSSTPQIGGGPRAMSLNIPQHGTNFSSVVPAMNSFQEALSTPPMYTPPEEAPQCSTVLSISPQPAERTSEDHSLMPLNDLDPKEWLVRTSIHRAKPSNLRSGIRAVENYAVQTKIPVQQHGGLDYAQQQPQVEVNFGTMNEPQNATISPSNLAAGMRERYDVSDQQRRPQYDSTDQQRRPQYNSTDQQGRPQYDSSDQQRRLQFDPDDQQRNFQCGPSDQERQPLISAGGQQRRAQYAASDQQRQSQDGTDHSPINQDGSSSGSLNHPLPYDHFDQYRMAAHPSAAKLAYANLARQQRSLRKPPSANRDTTGSEGLVRRSTLATSSDWKGGPRSRHIGRGACQGTKVSSGPQRACNALEGVRARCALEEVAEMQGSVPDIARLENTPLIMSREEAARLGSQRRQELQRMKEEKELLQNNPLRYIGYLCHPSVRAWIVRWKLPLIITILNFCLSVMFYRLIMYSQGGEDDP